MQSFSVSSTRSKQTCKVTNQCQHGVVMNLSTCDLKSGRALGTGSRQEDHCSPRLQSAPGGLLSCDHIHCAHWGWSGSLPQALKILKLLTFTRCGQGLESCALCCSSYQTHVICADGLREALPQAMLHCCWPATAAALGFVQCKQSWAGGDM